MKNIKSLLIMAVFLIIFIPLKIDAASLKIESDKKEALPKEEVSFKVSLVDVTTDINKLSITLKFDANKLEFSKATSTQGEVSPKIGNGVVNIELSSNKIANGDILNITMKTKDNATTGSSTIILTETTNSLTTMTTINHKAGTTPNAPNNNDQPSETPPSNQNTSHTLKELNVTGCTLSPAFVSTTFNYTCEDVKGSSVNIIASPTNANDKVSNTGVHGLVNGKNEIKVEVTSNETNDTNRTIYTININYQKDQETEKKAKLTNLTFNGRSITITNETTYLIGVDETATLINFETVTNPSNAKVNVEGNENLKNGINIITITVSAAGFEDTIYTLVVNKLEGPIISYLENITMLNNNLIYQTAYNPYIPSLIMEQLAGNPYNITYNNINTYNGLLYSLVFNKDVNYEGDYHIKFMQIGNEPLTFASNVPDNVNIKVFVNPLEVTGTSFYLYSYNSATNEYTLLNRNVEVENYYISFKSDGSSIYVLRETEISQTSDNKMVVANNNNSNNTTTYIILVLLGIAVGVLATMFGPKLLKKKNKPNIPNNDIERL